MKPRKYIRLTLSDYQASLERARDEGYDAGFKKGRAEVVSNQRFLQVEATTKLINAVGQSMHAIASVLHEDSLVPLMMRGKV